jgi:hypothetical protein
VESGLDMDSVEFVHPNQEIQKLFFHFFTFNFNFKKFEFVLKSSFDLDLDPD